MGDHPLLSFAVQEDLPGGGVQYLDPAIRALQQIEIVAALSAGEEDHQRVFWKACTILDVSRSSATEHFHAQCAAGLEHDSSLLRRTVGAYRGGLACDL